MRSREHGFEYGGFLRREPARSRSTTQVDWSRGRSSAGPPVAREDGELEPLAEAKRRAGAAFEKRYLVAAMEKAKGSVSEAARLADEIDATAFKA